MMWKEGAFRRESCFSERERFTDRILLADTAVLADEELFARALTWIPKERRAQIDRLASADDRRRSLGAGILLEMGLRGLGYSLLAGVPGKTHVNMKRGAFGKPYLAEQPDICFNLSHAGKYAAAVFCGCAVGIDIEAKRRVRRGVAERFFREEECAALSRGEHDFFWFWTRKESYIKAVGEGMHLPLTAFSVLFDRVEGTESYFLKTWEEEERLFLSVCAARPIAAEPDWVDLTKSI